MQHLHRVGRGCFACWITYFYSDSHKEARPGTIHGSVRGMLNLRSTCLRALPCISILIASGCDSDGAATGTPDAKSSSGAGGSTSSTTSTTGGGSPVCAPGTTEPCYEGPA